MRDSGSIETLPEPIRKGDLSLEELLTKRQSRRAFKTTPLSKQQLSQLLWAAYGLRDSVEFKRTVPSAGARLPLTVLACTGKDTVEGLGAGIWRYVAEKNTVEKLFGEDVRSELASAAYHQEFIADAPLCIAVAAVFEKTTSRYGQRGVRYVHIDVGHVGQNIYLEAEALGLGTVAVGAFDDEMVAGALRLSPPLAPLYLMPVGYSA
jgi:SagB-type dehydrogenase family enzyme